MRRQAKLEKDIRCPPEYGPDAFGGRRESRVIRVSALQERPAPRHLDVVPYSRPFAAGQEPIRGSRRTKIAQCGKRAYAAENRSRTRQCHLRKQSETRLVLTLRMRKRLPSPPDINQAGCSNGRLSMNNSKSSMGIGLAKKYPCPYRQPTSTSFSR